MGIFSSAKKKIRSKIRKIKKYTVYKIALPAVYHWYARRPVDEKLVLFADDRDRDMPDTFPGLYRMCQERGFRCVVFDGKAFGGDVPRRRRRVEKARSLYRFTKEFAVCRALFLSDYYAPAYIAKAREGQDIVQVWHACGAMKKFGYSTDGLKWGMPPREKVRYGIHANYTLAPVSGSKAVAPFRDGFRCLPQAVQVLGCTRTDVYFDEGFVRQTREKVRAMFPEIGDRKIILYAPTFRGSSVGRSHFESPLDYAELREELSDRFVLFTKFHPLMVKNGFTEKARIGGGAFVRDVTHVLSTEQALCAADVLISDYSSIAFEYLLLERPIISFIYDIDSYLRERGLYYPFEEIMPGPYCFTQRELVRAIRTMDEWFNVEQIRRYRREYMDGCDGHSTERIFQRVFGRETNIPGPA